MRRPSVQTIRRMAEALAYIRDYTDRHGYSPTQEEMARALGYAGDSGVSRLLDRMEHEGYLRRDTGAARSIHLLKTLS